MSLEQKRALISPKHKKMSIVKQCELLEITRSSHYYKPRGESTLNQVLMKAIDRKYLLHPFTGVAKIFIFKSYLFY